MLATDSTLAEEILELKRRSPRNPAGPSLSGMRKSRNSPISLANSLELIRKAQQAKGDVIAFCGVWFMAETAKILNPERIVVVPDQAASCSLVESCPPEPIREFRRRNPDYVIVSYINTSAEVKGPESISSAPRVMPSTSSIPSPRRKPDSLSPRSEISVTTCKEAKPAGKA